MIWISSIFGLQLVVSVLLKFGRQKTKRLKLQTEIQGTTIVIPFKNEAKRILPLIQSINQSAHALKHSHVFDYLDFIFIDDHSTDDTCSIILDQLDISYRLVKLNETFGKKYAIKHGVEQSKYNRILTLDADVTFEPHYLQHILKTPCDDLTILPVQMDGKSLFEKLNAIEFGFLQHLTFGMIGLKKPVLCNGANLLFSKSAYLKTLKTRTDAQIPSGDDVFLLQAILQQKGNISGYDAPALSVKTTAPENLKSLIQQRKRWIKKSINPSTILSGLTILSLNVLMLFCLYQSINQPIYLWPVFIKIVAELIPFYSVRQWPIIILHQIFYPVYLISIILSLPFKTKWR